MKVMLRRHQGVVSVYVAKKDLESQIVDMQDPAMWGGWIRLSNGWVLELPDMAADTRLPISVEARRINP
jgi:nitrogen fixation protein NifT